MMLWFHRLWTVFSVLFSAQGKQQTDKSSHLHVDTASSASSTTHKQLVVRNSSLTAVDFSVGRRRIGLADVASNPVGLHNLTNASVMLCSILKNEQLYIDEWLQYHRYLGFDHAHLFDNADNASVYLAGLPERYGDFVRVTHLPGLGKQSHAYSTCVKEGSGSNTWAAFIDIDEFIVLRNHSSIKAFLQDVAPKGGSVVLNWSMMGSNGTLHYTPAPVLTRFTLTSKAPNQHIKTIAYLPHVLRPNIHNCYMKPGHATVDQHGRAVDPNSPFHPGNDREIAHINHYYTKSWEEFKLKRHRGFASNYLKNHLFEDESKEAIERIFKDYTHANSATNAVQDTFARDFFLKRHFSGKFL